MELNRLGRNRGFSAVEMLVVTTIIAIIIAASASYLSSSVALRRSVDDITANIATTLQLIKLRSGRSGVEYRAVFAKCTEVDDTDPDCLICNTYSEYSEGDEEISIIVERGDSNRGSATWCMQTRQTKKFRHDLDLVASANLSTGPLRISFIPMGLRSDFRTDANNETLSIEPAEGAPVDKCGRVDVTPVGGISIVHGRWSGTACIAILDAEPTPGPS